MADPLNRSDMAQASTQPAEIFHAVSRLHQILIVDGLGMPSCISESVQRNIQTFQETYPGADHILWTGEMLRDFIRDHFGNEVLSAFDTLKPYSYKCDLARFCLVQASGGLYSDLGLQHYAPWKIPREYRIAAFQEICLSVPDRFDVTTGLLWSAPNSPTLERVIDRIVENCKSGFVGRRTGDVTGPGLLGWAWAQTYLSQWEPGTAQDQYLGHTAFTDIDGAVEMRFYPIGPQRQLIARRLPRKGGDDHYIGSIGTNNYVEMWHRRDIYS
jgi:hypothetical protein